MKKRAYIWGMVAVCAVTAPAWGQDLFDQAVTAYQSQDYATARKLWKQDLAAGDWEAARSLGTMARKGLGQPVDLAQAARYYQTAVDHGVVTAELNLAELYLSGQGVPRDVAKAKSLLSHAADHGSLPARYRLEEIDEAQSRNEPPPALDAPVSPNARISLKDAAPPPPTPGGQNDAASEQAPVGKARAHVATYPDENAAAAGWLNYNLPGLEPDVDTVTLPGRGKVVRLWAVGPAETIQQLCRKMSERGEWCQSVQGAGE